MTSGPIPSRPAPTLISATPRSATELVDLAFSLVRRDYPTLLVVSAVPFLPVVLLTPFGDALPQLLTVILAVTSAGWAEACLLLAIAAIYRGEPLSAADSLLRAGTRIAGRVIRITLVRNITTAFGLVLLIVPGLLAFAHYVLGAPAAAIEDLKVGPAIKRGGALASGEYGRILGVSVLLGVIYVLLFAGSTAVVGMLTQSERIGDLAGTAVQVMLTPLFVALTVILYYDIRERREGLDIEMALAQDASPAV